MSCIKRSFWKVVIQRTFRGWWSRRLQVFQVEVAPETFLTLEIGRHLHDFGGRKRTGFFALKRAVNTAPGVSFLKTVATLDAKMFLSERCGTETCQTRRMDNHVAQIHFFCRANSNFSTWNKRKFH